MVKIATLTVEMPNIIPTYLKLLYCTSYNTMLSDLNSDLAGSDLVTNPIYLVYKSYTVK